MTQTVLLIDDDEAMRLSTEQALELAGYHVRSFPAAEPALDAAGRGLNGVVVTDIRMPGMDGMDLLRRLSELDPELPVILITGHADVSLAVEAMRRGAYDFIEKPFSIQTLTAVMRRALDHRALVIENRRLRAVAGQRDDIEARLPGRSAAMDFLCKIRQVQVLILRSCLLRTLNSIMISLASYVAWRWLARTCEIFHGSRRSILETDVWWRRCSRILFRLVARWCRMYICRD